LVLHVTPAQLLTVDVGAGLFSIISFAERVPAFEGLPRQEFQYTAPSNSSLIAAMAASR
jgi:hypothetical protein